MKVEYFNPQEYLDHLFSHGLLKGIPFLAINAYGEEFYRCGKVENGPTIKYSLNTGEKELLSLVLPEDCGVDFDLLEDELERFFAYKADTAWQSQNATLTNDLIAKFKESEDLNLELAELLFELVFRLKSHIMCKQFYFYTLKDEIKIIPVIGDNSGEKVTFDQFQSPRLDYFAHIVSTNKKILFSQHGDLDPIVNHLPAREGQVFKNLVGIPILHKETLIGVFILANKMNGTYKPLDLEILRRFEKFTSHILEENFAHFHLYQAERLTSNLSKYLSSNVAEKIKQEGIERVGGVKKKIVAMFVLLQNFEFLEKNLPVKILFPLLNFYYNSMHEIVQKYDGTLDKIISPAFMVVWNHPYQQDNAEELAAECARELVINLIRNINPVFEKNKLGKLTIGIGVNSGEAVAGNLGCDEFMDYTVIGDTINTAQRLEANAGRNQIFLSESVYRFIYGNNVESFDKKVEVKAKGKSKPIIAYNYGIVRKQSA